MRITFKLTEQQLKAACEDWVKKNHASLLVNEADRITVRLETNGDTQDEDPGHYASTKPKLRIWAEVDVLTTGEAAVDLAIKNS